MKKHLIIGIIGLLILSISSCKPERDIDYEMKEKISEFYKMAEAKNYEPISFSTLDTIQNLRNPDGSIVRIQGTIIHEFYANSKNGNQNKFTEIFDITIFPNDVIAIPQSYK
ncbi:MAG: hypothetical protein WBA61_00175 [Aequorivita sp.]